MQNRSANPPASRIPAKRSEPTSERPGLTGPGSMRAEEEPLMVTQEAVDAYEKRTGFYGIGRIMVEDGHWIIVSREELARSRARMHANHSAVTRQRGVA